MKRIYSISIMGAVVFGIWSCHDGPTNPYPISQSEAKLIPLSDCDDVEDTIRTAALNKMNQQIDAYLKNALASNGQDCYYEYEDRAMPGAPAPQATNLTGAQSGNSSKDSSHATQVSGTNNQVLGVDEADFVKNDTKYIYLLSDGYFHIYNAWPADQTHEIAKVKIEGAARKLFVEGNRALIYSSLPPRVAEAPFPDWAETSGAANAKVSSSSVSPDYGSYRECTYGYDCQFTGDGRPTKITILDITQRSQPKLVRELKFSGSLLSARRVGESVFTVVSDMAVLFPNISYWPALKNWSYCGAAIPEADIVDAFEALREANEKIILSTPIDTLLPAILDEVQPQYGSTSQKMPLKSCSGFYKASVEDGGQFTTIVALKLTEQEDVSTSTIISRPGAVYASGDALYMAVTRAQSVYDVYETSANDLHEASAVHKFLLDAVKAKTNYLASGIVKGHVLNQFALDEHNGHLRIATTTGRVPQDDVHSTLTVLKQNGEVLEPAGIVDGLAPSEDIRSVRFDGDRGFIVTFKKTDPLFVIDLSKPSLPKVLAELKIPGFSTYMQMMDKNHLLSIGYDADDQGSFAWFTGVLLQIFDISDPSDPVRTHKYVIGTRGSTSEALTNHLAFNYFAPKGVLALPMTICEGGSGSGGSFGDTMTFSGLMVFNVSADTGFSQRGQVPHPLGPEATCYNWWTQASSQVKRSIIMDDYIYSISSSLMKVNHLDHLGIELKYLPITN